MRVTYGHLLRDFTLTLPYGTCTALTGPVGCGKSTVLRLLLGLTVPQEGDAFFDGQWYSEWPSLALVRQHLGYVPQQPRMLVHGTLLENVLYGHPSGDSADLRRRATDLLVDMGFTTESVSVSVGKDGMALSGGQRQLAWVARVLLHDPRVLLLDEPSASMDERCTATLVRLLTHVMETTKTTVLVVSHDPRLVAHAHHRVCL